MRFALLIAALFITDSINPVRFAEIVKSSVSGITLICSLLLCLDLLELTIKYRR